MEFEQVTEPVQAASPSLTPSLDMKYGVLLVSLDLELYWGMRDRLSIEQYRQNLQGAREAILGILRVFDENDVHATWATVGFLFFSDLDQLKKNIPDIVPNYKNDRLSPYNYIYGSSKLDGQYHFCPELIDLIRKYKGQEIGTHTFSHYYCLEDGQSMDEFSRDMESAVKVSESNDVYLKSIVFPRNQCNIEYISSLSDFGIECYRGVENSWIHKPCRKKKINRFKRAIRLADNYINISGHNTYDIGFCRKNKPFNFPSSRFLRPYSGKLSFLDGLRLRRIARSMDDAAINHRVFHIWWHPHNFGTNTNLNIDFLEKIMVHYAYLKKIYGMKSLNMGELCAEGD